MQELLPENVFLKGIFDSEIYNIEKLVVIIKYLTKSDFSITLLCFKYNNFKFWTYWVMYSFYNYKFFLMYIYLLFWVEGVKKMLLSKEVSDRDFFLDGNLE